MKAASLFSGIGAPEVAMPDWQWRWCAEIEAFPCAVMAARHPKTINLGSVAAHDFAEKTAGARADVIVFGSPCQSFSVAGRRLGLDDPRGNLALIALGLVGRLRPRWFVFENVPGLLSSDAGRDFGAFLGIVGELGYGFAYRVLDAQYFGVPQRRRRVFVVGCLGDWRLAAAVLFERESLRRDHPPRRDTREGIAPTIASRPTGGGGLGTDFDCDGGLIAKAVPGRPWPALREDADTLIPDIAWALQERDHKGADSDTKPGHLIPIVTADPISANEGRTYTHEGRGNFRLHNVVSGVRRLTPRECERLQGFPDDYTQVVYRKRPAADGPRYKALGNSMAVPVMRWILTRIELMDGKVTLDMRS